MKARAEGWQGAAMMEVDLQYLGDSWAAPAWPQLLHYAIGAPTARPCSVM